MNNIIEAIKSELHNKVKISYEHFDRCVISEAKAYQKENPNIWLQLLSYLTRHNHLTASDVCEYMGYLIGLPYQSDADGKWYRWDTEITETEAQRIVNEKYSG